MDPRIRTHAEIIVDHSTRIESGDNVVVSMPAAAEDLAVALHEVLGDRGANPVYVNNSERAARAYLRASGADAFETPSHQLALFEAADAFVIARGGANVSEQSDVTPETNAAYRRAMRPVLDERLGKRWCLTQFPSAGHAQLAGMSTEAYENFVWDAVTLDWDEQRDHQAQMVEIMDGADGVTETVVYGVEIPGTNGRAGMACARLDTEPEQFDWQNLANYLKQELPPYAIPIFIRVTSSPMQTTGTFKHQKTDLKKEGYDLSQQNDPVYAWLPGEAYYQPFTPEKQKAVENNEYRF